MKLFLLRNDHIYWKAIRIMSAPRTNRPIFSVGQTVIIAHGLLNSEGFRNSEYLPNEEDESIGLHVNILQIVSSNGKRIEECFNSKMNCSLKLLVEPLYIRRTRLPNEFWIKAVDVVNYDLMGWSSEATEILKTTKDKNLSWFNFFSEMNNNNNELRETFQFIENRKNKDIQDSTDSLIIEAKKVYRKQFYHFVQVNRIKRWQKHVEFANK